MMEHNERADRSDDRDGGAAEGKQGPSIALIAMIVLAVAALIFVVRNSDKASIDFVFTDVELAIWVVIAFSIATGILLDRLFSFWWRRARRRND